MTKLFSTPNTATFGTATISSLSPPNGELLFLVLAANVSNTNFTTLSGWTKMSGFDMVAGVGMAAYYRVAGASEPASYTWSISGSPSDVLSLLLLFDPGSLIYFPLTSGGASGSIAFSGMGFGGHPGSVGILVGVAYSSASAGGSFAPVVTGIGSDLMGASFSVNNKLIAHVSTYKIESGLQGTVGTPPVSAGRSGTYTDEGLFWTYSDPASSYPYPGFSQFM